MTNASTVMSSLVPMDSAGEAMIDDELAHFQNLPLAQPTISDPNFKPIHISRTLTHNNLGHTLMASTWKTPETIAHLVSFCRQPPPSQPRSPKILDKNEATRVEVRRFYTFGNGLNAHANLLHGGVIATILDSTMANVTGLAANEVGMFTVQLNVKYEKPVSTPGTVMLRAWVEKLDIIEEKDKKKIKAWAVGEITGGERGEITHARAEGLWIKGVLKVSEKGKL